MFLSTLRVLLAPILFLILLSTLSGQTLKWGEVGPVDLKATTYEDDSTAAAAVLGHTGSTTVQYGDDGRPQYVMQVHRRVKVYRAAALDEYANVSLEFYHADEGEFINRVEALTIQPDGRKVLMANKDLRYEKLDDKWSRVVFSFPGAAVGSVLEYRYQLVSHDLVQPRAWYFREEIPVRLSEYQFKSLIPYSYRYFVSGLDFLPAGVNRDGSRDYRLGEMTLRVGPEKIVAQNAAAMRPEAFVTNMNDYRIAVHYQLEEYLDRFGKHQPILRSWEETLKLLDEHDNFGRQLAQERRHKEVLAAAASALPAQASPDSLVRQIKRFVGGRVQWNGKRSYFAEYDLDEALKRGTANSGAIQLMGLLLLRRAGLEAYPVLISTRDHGALLSDYPLMEQFNYSFVALRTGKGYQLLDFTDPLLPPGLLTEMALNHLGLLADPANLQWLTINVSKSPNTFVADVVLGDDGSLSGQMKMKAKGMTAQQDRRAYAESGADAVWRERLAGYHPNLTISNVTVNDDIEQGLLNTQFDFRLADPQSGTADLLYLHPFLYLPFRGNPFVADQRSYPVDLPFPREERVQINLKWPAGYSLQETPQNVDLRLPNNAGSLNCVYRPVDQGLSVIYILHLNQTYYKPEEYKALYDWFQQVAATAEEVVVLKRV